MSCGHGWHGCGPSYSGHYGRGCDEPVDWFEASDWPARGRARRYERLGRDEAADDLEARLGALRDEIRRVEADLASLRSSGSGATQRP